MLSLSDITAVLQNRWQTVAPDTIPTQFPGVPLDASALESWFEFWVTHGVEPPHREPGAETLTVLIDVHCCSRSVEKRYVFELADAVRLALAHQALPLSTAGNIALTEGTLRIREAVVRDLTRESIQERQLPLQRVVVTLTGRAEKSYSTLDPP